VIRRAGRALLDLWEDDSAKEEMVYDPVQAAAVVVGCLVAMGTLFWILWALLVFEGGLFTKIGPFFQVVLTSKTLSDYGYQGSPQAMGLFKGWPVNLLALLLSLSLIFSIRYTLKK
jgi:uncharacterized membrane protein